MRDFGMWHAHGMRRQCELGLRATFLRACGACMAHARMLAGVPPSRGPYWLCSISMPASGSLIPSCDGTLANPAKKWLLGCPAGADIGDGVGYRAAGAYLMYICNPSPPYFPCHIACMHARCTFHAMLHAVLACLAGAARAHQNRAPTCPRPVQ